ncbi:hypothetical protein FHS18_004804 [Paenibacillus phyllosphaerae]|uniref:DUF4367 domain-containing protein n=1 Tax=Paenibacillus phyllosphaerae TaxID=274593 RepID=A0A7W5B1K2_9BACL|nr:hypothetical protein [Paenibacillus phyllosphaerae]MBB3112702.1 hypothetical protein [Paenibacillus phyllosphaerae]
MADMDRKVQEQFRKEADEMLFSRMELSNRVKDNIRQQAAAEKVTRRSAFPKRWYMAAGALAVAVMFVAGYPLLEQAADPAPVRNEAGGGPSVNEGGTSTGTDLSALITTPLGSAEEAKTAFGSDLLLPGVTLEGYSLSEMVSVGMENEPVRDIIFTYVSGEKAVTFTASRMAAAFPQELFSKTQVSGAEGFVLEQETYTELFWTVDGVQYGISGPITGAEAMALAESLTK